MPPPAGEAGFTAAELSDPSSLPESVADQIQAARVRAALLGQGPAAWAVGAKCQAQYSVDGEYYDATVDGVTADGKFVVVFDGYETKEEVSARGLLPRRWASGGASWAGWAGGGGRPPGGEGAGGRVRGTSRGSQVGDCRAGGGSGHAWACKLTGPFLSCGPPCSHRTPAHHHSMPSTCCPIRAVRLRPTRGLLPAARPLHPTRWP